ncbi:39S ribosomal protein L22, mitochondrial [Yamadazyma tenuis]|uniref:Ribosomal protein L22 n=1 Tax=Candida tenuis (strain ATCC 10573 / BCRC 21748 / CBS 615 / JCM 9827 / NBRC 10315 / NRRL Y-1498 / VKM Y-70) TaxID=590646 RepID=G3B3V3_CANTC|nr:ribosomal protein L22 [Yamadazyma tenuis ATCC 10573]EGV63741.1 ribosomal protein L22 [Yamadazyma tenuis ATCC 10573]WEJ96649.1 39S ribosomal protein L22, mitochondrial [Yamadazyma tenuis]
MLPINRIGLRSFHNSVICRNSLFGEFTKRTDPVADFKPKEVTEVDSESDKKVRPKDDQDLQAFYRKEMEQKQISDAKFITPLKRELFQLNVDKNGFFKNHDIVTKDSKPYKISLTEKEIDILEPTIFLKSLRLKGSMKKATIVNRFVRGLNVKNAINQLHFNPKKMSTELEKLLKQGLEQSRELNMNEDKLYIQSLWVGSDGDWQKRLDPKGRGRMGMIRHRYVHLKCILKGDLTKKRLAYERQLKDSFKKPKMGLNNQPLNFSNVPFYKW